LRHMIFMSGCQKAFLSCKYMNYGHMKAQVAPIIGIVE
jgi:hypothetical protein